MTVSGAEAGRSRYVGVACALSAALCNATIGIFTNLGIESHLRPETIAFYRCLIAFIVVALYGALTRRERAFELGALWRALPKILICAFFGVFVLYYFETLSYRATSVANVTFLLMSSSTLVTFLIASLLLREKSDAWKLGGLGLVLGGLFLMVFERGIYTPSAGGDLLAITAGVGYSLFLILTRRFKLGTSLPVLGCFFAAGTVYLAVPLLRAGGFGVGLRDLPILLLLGIIPTLGGFYLTARALHLLDASRVQLLEMSEPIFASALAFVILGQRISLAQACGGICILSGLFLAERLKGARARLS